MTKESFRTRLKSGEMLYGTLLSLSSLEAAEILAASGFDWLFVDKEHSVLDPAQVQNVLQAVAGRADCILRIPLNDEIWIKKALDTGATGIMVPQVNTAEEARRAVRLSKYAPLGTRSVGVSRAHGYGATLADYLQRANDETVIVVQAEHIQAVENIESILDVEGIDAVLVGPYDLSASMGLMGQVDSPEVQEAIAQVRRACRARGMPLGIFAVSGRRAHDYAADGFTLLAGSSDTLMLVQAAHNTLNELRGAS